MTFGLFGPLAFIAANGLWIPILLLLLSQPRALGGAARTDYADHFRRNAAFFAVPLYGLLTVLWSIAPERAVSMGLKLTGYLVLALVVVFALRRMPSAGLRAIPLWAAAGFVLAQGVALADLAAAGAISGLWRDQPFHGFIYNRGAAATACVLPLLALALYRLGPPALAWGFAAACGAAVFASDSEGAKAALVLGMAVFALVRWRGALYWPAILLPLALGFAAPALFVGGFGNDRLCAVWAIQPSAAHRLAIYEFVSGKALERPLFGWGLDSARTVPGGQESRILPDCAERNGKRADRNLGPKLALHPHNASLQLWLELGLAGVLGCFALVILVFRRLRRDRPDAGDGAAIAGAFVATFVIFNVSFGAWQGWLMFLVILLSVLIAVMPPRPA